MLDQSTTSLYDSNTSSPLHESKKTESESNVSESIYKSRDLFSIRLKKQSAQMEILEVFKQVKVNTLLPDAIQQLPSYAKFLKDFCTKKRTTNVPKKVFLAANISEILSNLMLVKYTNLSCPTISCTIRNTIIDKTLLELGASVNLLPYSVYKHLGVSEFEMYQGHLQLIERSVKIFRGEVENVLIKVGEFIFSVDFIVLKTEPFRNPQGQIPLILGRPFLATSNALINCPNGLMKFTFDNITSQFEYVQYRETTE